MLQTLNALRIQTRIGLLAAVVVVGVAVVGITALVADRTVGSMLAADDHNDKLGHLVVTVHVNLLRMRSAEKDFLLDRERGYVERHRDHAEWAGAALAALARLPHPGFSDAQLQRVQAEMRRHTQEFAAVVRLTDTLGRNQDLGLQGAFREAAHGIEAILARARLEHLTMLMLMLRRHEKDFLLRGDGRYVGRFETRMAAFRAELARSRVAGPTKARIAKLAGEYDRLFHRWVEGARALRRETARLDASYEAMRRDLSALRASAAAAEDGAEDRLGAVRATARTALLAIGALILLVSIAFAATIGRSIIRPLEAMNAALADLAEGNTEREIPGTARRDEIGEIARAAMVFKENAIARASAEAASEAKSSFLATASHEIRTPVNGIMGTADLLLDTPLSDKQLTLVKTSQKSAKDLLAIINNVLDHSKLDAKMIEIEDRDFDLFQLVNHVLSVLGVQAAEKSIDLSWHHPENLPRYLKADDGRLQQILLNLIGNAIKFTDEGSVTLFVMHRPGPDGTIDLRCEIKDTGIGIKPEHREKLFDRYAQAERSTTRTHGGTGLGLAISRQLVELMGGEIGLESSPGQGSTFWFTIRCAPGAPEAASEPAERAAAPEAALRPLRVLLAEDNRVNQMLLNEILRAEGHTAEIVENGAQAVEAARNGGFDLILMDVQMPEVDGITATKQIRALPGAPSQVPIIAVTAHAMVGDRENYLAAGMDEYVSKPIDRTVLFETIARALEQRGHAPADAPTDEAPPAPQPTPVEPASAEPAPAEAAPAPEAAAEPADRPTPETLPVLVTTVIEEWKSFLTPEKFRELIASHLGFARDCIPLLSERGQSGSLADLAELAHDLKGTCASLGMARVERLAADLEAACKQERKQEALELVSTVGAAVADGVEAIETKFAA